MYNEIRLKELGLATLESRKISGDLIEMFKILCGFVSVDRNVFFTRRESLEKS